MQLPKIDQPTYTAKLLSIKDPVSFRPFLVKEQKILMMAAEGKDIDSILKGIKQIITNCVLDPIKVDDLPLVDLEMLFLHLRARSMGEVLNLYFKCTNDILDPSANMITSNMDYPTKPCGMLIEVPVNLLQVPIVNQNTSNKLMVSKDVGIMMKYPSMKMIDNLVKSNSTEVIFTVIASCIESIFDRENVYKAKDATMEELVQFVEQLPADKFDILEQYIENTPKMRFETKQKCVKCSMEHDFVLEGLSDFFL